MVDISVMRSSIFILLLILAPSFRLSPAQNSGRLPNNYSLSIDVRSDSDSFTTYRVFLLKSGKTTPISRNEINHYSLITFNRPKDILWAGCANGYKVAKATSRTGAQIINDPVIGAGIVFSENRRYKTYNLTISCTKSS